MRWWLKNLQQRKDKSLFRLKYTAERDKGRHEHGNRGSVVLKGKDGLEERSSWDSSWDKIPRRAGPCIPLWGGGARAAGHHNTLTDYRTSGCCTVSFLKQLILKPSV